jgi:heme exporter protein D
LLCTSVSVIVAVAKKNDDVSDSFDMISLLLNVVEAPCKQKDMIQDIQQERARETTLSKDGQS